MVVLFLCLHGNIEDEYWGKLSVESMTDERYSMYDYVFFGAYSRSSSCRGIL